MEVACYADESIKSTISPSMSSMQPSTPKRGLSHKKKSSKLAFTARAGTGTYMRRRCQGGSLSASRFETAGERAEEKTRVKAAAGGNCKGNCRACRGMLTRSKWSTLGSASGSAIQTCWSVLSHGRERGYDILSCNVDDLDYYDSCPRGYLNSVREWKERLFAHHRAIGLPLD